MRSPRPPPIDVHDLQQCVLYAQVNTLQQLENISSHEFIMERVVADKVRLNAMWFDVYTGDFYMFSRERETFVQVTQATYEHLVADAESW